MLEAMFQNYMKPKLCFVKCLFFSFLCTILSDMLMDNPEHTDTLDVQSETRYENPLSQSPLLPHLLLSLTNQKYTPDGTENINDEYDYVIVGGGTAGSVVASRLSEEPCVNVLLLEAGPKPPLISEVPGLCMSLLDTDVDWKFDTVPQKHLRTGLKNKQIRLNSGKMLGGSGNHNYMIYARGNRKNYDDWAAQGAKGWSYEDIFPYFLKLEDNRNFFYLVDGYHAVGGPITVEKPCYYSSVKSAFYKSVRELGYEFVDPNGATQTGFYDYQMNVRNGQRCSSVKAYLVPAAHRSNLDILMNATVTKVIVDAGEAKGVNFYHKGELKIVKARQEVIVSGGTINTPKLLMLSGIGPKEELEKWNIGRIIDLPVGKNLQDHGGSGYFFTIDPQYSWRNSLRDPSTVMEYINNRSGSLSIIGEFLVAFLSSLDSNSARDFPNYELYIDEISKGSEESSSLEPEIYRQFFGPIDGNLTFFACLPIGLQPRSKGTVSLRSLNPFDSPVVDPNYLAHPKDINDIVDGLRMCKTIVNTEAVRLLGARPFHTLMPGCEDFVNSDQDYFKCFARRYFMTDHHLVGTSKMGDPKDPSTVVDPELRVKGVKGLRVVDASVMPIVPSGNTNIPTIMIAEKASDMIKETMQCF